MILDVFLGPVCKYALAPVARFASHWNIPVFSTGGQPPAFRDKKKDYRLLTTVSTFDPIQLIELLLNFFKEKNWYVIVQFLSTDSYSFSLISAKILKNFIEGFFKKNKKIGRYLYTLRFFI